MFNQLTRYVFEQWLPQPPPAAEGVETARLTSTAAEDDWVLVERRREVDSAGNSRCSSLESVAAAAEDDGLLVLERGPDRVVVVDAAALPPPGAITRTSSMPQLDQAWLNPGMEESWFLTPPPCFISTGPVHMETSPLENLLIEHPSMSVYTHHGRSRYNLAPEEDVVAEEVEQSVVVVHRTPRVGRVHTLQQQEVQGLKGRHAQKVQIKNSCKAVTRGSLNRTNKAREVNSRNQRQRRGERSQGATRSCANNNRKC